MIPDPTLIGAVREAPATPLLGRWPALVVAVAILGVGGCDQDAAVSGDPSSDLPTDWTVHRDRPAAPDGATGSSPFEEDGSLDRVPPTHEPDGTVPTSSDEPTASPDSSDAGDTPLIVVPGDETPEPPDRAEPEIPEPAEPAEPEETDQCGDMRTASRVLLRRGVQDPRLHRGGLDLRVGEQRSRLLV